MKKAFAYCRFSSDMQREESIEAQVRAITKYCEDNNFVLLAVYADRGISATTDKRPEFQNMISAATKGDVDAVIVHKFDRFARNRYDSAFYKNILKKHGVKLISVLENLQDTPESVILESVIEGMNEYYSLNLAREVKKGLCENALSCKATGGVPPLGYVVDPQTNKYIIDPFEAEAVKLIFQMYLDGASYTEIISVLNSKGYKTKRGLTFAKNSLYEILKNEKYTGIYVYVKDSTKNPKGKYVRHGKYDPDAVIRIPEGIPQIISEEDFKLVQAKLKERQHKSARFSAKQEYLLSGKIYCSECGSPYAGNSRKPRPDHPMYISYKCTRRNQRIQRCNNPEINRDILEGIVLQHLSDKLFNPDIIPFLAKRYNEYVLEKTGGARNKRKAVAAELLQVERKVNNVVNLMAETGSAALASKLRELEETKEKLRFELAELDTALKTEPFSEDNVREMFMAARSQLQNGTLAVRKKIIEQYVNKVVVHPDKVEVFINVIGDYVIKSESCK